MDADSSVDSSGASEERKEEVNRDVTLGEHLRHLNQPSMITEEDEDSLGSTDLFDAPKSGLAKSKPLLAAAIKAREQADQLEREQQTKPGKLVNESQSKEPSRKWSIEETVYGFHLRDLNQPVVITEEDEDSLGSTDLFDAPKSVLAKSKPLLAAAIKAREQADQLELEEQTNRNATLGEHLHGMNQPSTIAEEDEDSLGSMDLFDAPKSGLANSKPLLAAAIKAREQADNFERAEPAKPMTTVEEDQESILESDSSSSSDSTPTTSDSPEKDAQAAAGADVFEDANLSPSTETTQLLPFIQLELANVPQSAYLMDADSSVDSSGASEERKEEVNRDVTLGEHLRHLNQPSMNTEEDEDSLGSTDLFDAPKSGLAKSKPLLAAAIKAREQADQLEREQQTKPGKLVNESQSKEPSRKWSIEETVYGFHLRDLNQPVVITEEDEDSLGSMDLFDAPKSGLAKSKPLLAAAIKAREQADQKELEEQTNRNATLGEHLHGMNQPSTIAEEDEDSLGSMDLFDAPKSGLANSKPLLAAAIKAREQADNFERAEPAKPMTIVEEDQESILESDSSSRSDPTSTTPNSPEKDAQAAAGADLFEDANLSPSAETTKLFPFIQLELAKVPQSAYLMDADSSVDSSGASGERKEEVNRDVTLGEHLRHLNQPSMITEEDEDSLGSTDLFDAPKSGLAKSKPLLAAAIKAREQADQLEREQQTKPGKLVNESQSKEPSRKWSIEETVYGFHLRDLNQPVVITEEDEDSLGSMDLFDAPKSGLAKSKPLLAAAIKAREQADQLELEEQTNRNATLGEHLHGMNQPSTIAEEDEDSLGSMDLFDAPKSGLANSKPLLAAAIKAREQADNFERAEPAKPMTIVEEDQESILESDSSSSSDPTSTTPNSPEKDAQAAAGADVFEDANLSPSAETTQLLPLIQLELANVPQSAYLMDADSSVDSSGASGERKEEVNRDVTLGEHLRHLNQPSMITEEDEDSLGSTDLFDAPKSGLAKSKPLLAAAIKAREQADQLEREQQTKPGKLVNESQSKEPSRKWSIEETVYGFHLRDLNQPVVITEEDEDSLGSMDLFDAPKSGLAKSKPLLAAAIKAREQADQLELEEQTNRNATLGEHLHGMNQPSTIAEEDEDSLGSMDLFDAPKSGLANSKPLLAAAIKAREQADNFERAEPAKPMTIVEEDQESILESDSSSSSDSTSTTSDSPEKDAQAAAGADLFEDANLSPSAETTQLLPFIQLELANVPQSAYLMDADSSVDSSGASGERKEEVNRDVTLGEHLRHLNQPSMITEEDEDSLGSTDLFDAPKSGLAKSKPLLAAAIKAREQADQLEREQQTKPGKLVNESQSKEPSRKWSIEETVYGFHLRDLNQPVVITEEDEDSLGSMDLFDAPKSGLAKSKPLLAAAIKAREQADQLELEEQTNRNATLGEHLHGMNQPSTIAEEDEDSLGSMDLFDAPKSGLAKSKPLLAAAIKARKQSDQLELEEQTKRNVTLRDHLHGMNQPFTIAEKDEDSLGSADLSDSLKSGLAMSKPLLAVAVKDREQADQLELEGETQPTGNFGVHLDRFNQPTTVVEDEEESLGSNVLFDPPKSALTNSKPLLAAAIKAREQLDDQPGEIQIKIVSIDEQKSSDSAKKITNPIEGEGKDLSESSLEKNTSGNSGLDSAEYLSTVVNTVPNGRNDGSSLDDSSLSTGELDELEYLFQVMEEGDEYDKKRLYDLDLIAKSEAGMELDQDEKMDLAIIMQNRRKERAYRNEFRVLLDKKEKGKEVDESRLLFLELFARRHLGESLSEDELGYLMAVEEEAMLLEN
ncbi:unnamed protein product [Cylindrotheca closterium]|uniref:Uncharacterized protein n=1 Tax=Cylindrotheca closterium TaxID=2856 RepID=A0AAD2G3P3_9STRA|nr:unnamed protein product [Cylindrotheca closterium]